MNISARRWIILGGGALVIGLTLFGRWMMRPDAEEVSPSTEPIASAPAQGQPSAVAEATSDVPLPEREATPEKALPLPRALGLHGRVYDEDTTAPIVGAHIMVRPTGIGSRDAQDLDIRVHGKRALAPELVSSAHDGTAHDGTFALEGLVPGRIMVSVSAPDYVGRNLEVVVGDDAAPLEIGLFAGGTITGRLVAADGTTPVAGRTGLFDLDRSSGISSTTSGAGRFEYQQLPPGRYRLKGQAEGGAATREIVLAKGQRIEGIILALTAAHSIRGVVTGLRPTELGLVTISLGRDDDMGDVHAVSPDHGGAFVIHGVAPGRVYVTADLTGRRQMSKAIEMPGDSDLTVNLDFPRGVRLSGRITRGGEPLSNVDIAPLPPRGVQPSVYVNGTSTSNEGTYVIEDLPPGKYVLLIDRFQSGPVEVSGDTVFDFDVPGGELSGRVLAAGGEPIAGAEIYIWAAQPDEMQRPLPYGSDQAGRFTLLGLEPGDFLLSVYKPGYEMLRNRISYDARTPELTVELRVERGVEVTAREVSTGKPARQLIALEVIGSARGSLLRLQLDEDGKGYLPSALAGSTLKFIAPGCVPTVIDSWNGDTLDLQLEREGAR